MTSIENENPAVLSAMANPQPQTGANNSFGVITTEPIKIIDENHRKNHIKVSVYEMSGLFYFGYQLKVSRTIRQKIANINDTPYSSINTAIMAARKEIKQICGHSHFVKDTLEDFTSVFYNQPELF